MATALRGAILRGRCRKRTSSRSEGATAALNGDDVDGFLTTVHPDAEFKSLIAEAEGETFRGHDGVRRLVDGALCSRSADLHGEVEEVRDLGDTRCIVTARRDVSRQRGSR